MIAHRFLSFVQVVGELLHLLDQLGEPGDGRLVYGGEVLRGDPQQRPHGPERAAHAGVTSLVRQLRLHLGVALLQHRPEAGVT